MEEMPIFQKVGIKELVNNILQNGCTNGSNEVFKGMKEIIEGQCEYHKIIRFF